MFEFVCGWGEGDGDFFYCENKKDSPNRITSLIHCPQCNCFSVWNHPGRQRVPLS